MTIHQAYQQLLAQLYAVYNNREAANIGDWVIEHVTGQKKIDRIVYKDLPLTQEQQSSLAFITGELLQHKPVQYVLKEAWFYGMKLYVNEEVLIPRPETEELVEWIIDDYKGTFKRLKEDDPGGDVPCILDVGTGSGCIAISLKLKIGKAAVYALDISQGALLVAEQNAREQQAHIEVQQLNILDEGEWHKLPVFDIIVSNPPYVKLSERESMDENVVKYEPHTALFVPDEDPLVFYKALAGLGRFRLTENGSLYAEINEALGVPVVELLRQYGYKNVELKKDMQGKDRMIKARK